jgi:hypothetical protein
MASLFGIRLLASKIVANHRPEMPIFAIDRFANHQTSPLMLEMIGYSRFGVKPELQYPQFDWKEQIPDIERPGKRWTTEAEFVVVGRSVHDPGYYLRTLIISWSRGRATRIGCAWISETDCVESKNREFKKVVLA